jgi:hypothetical protein
MANAAGMASHLPDFNEDGIVAAVRQWEAEIEAFSPMTPEDKAFARGLVVGFKTFDPRWQALTARRAKRERAFAASPEGRAMKAWVAMLKAADVIVDEGCVEKLLAEAGSAAPVVATAADILRSAAIARGEITPLPVDKTARDVIRMGQRRRNEPEGPA